VPEVYISFAQLKNYGIPWSRVHVGNLVDAGMFPPPRQLSANRIAWDRESIEIFLASRPNAGEKIPVLWAVRERPVRWVDPGAKPRGRPAGSRVVLDADGRRRLVRPRGLGPADAAD
jgi:hypothetical protein